MLQRVAGHGHDVVAMFLSLVFESDVFVPLLCPIVLDIDVAADVLAAVQITHLEVKIRDHTGLL